MVYKTKINKTKTMQELASVFETKKIEKRLKK
jgi:hypothetical protein